MSGRGRGRSWVVSNPYGAGKIDPQKERYYTDEDNRCLLFQVFDKYLLIGYDKAHEILKQN